MSEKIEKVKFKDLEVDQKFTQNTCVFRKLPSLGISSIRLNALNLSTKIFFYIDDDQEVKKFNGDINNQ